MIRSSKLLLAGSLAGSLAVVPMASYAQPVVQARCSADSLDASQAAARLEWARKCGLTLNTGLSGSAVTTTAGYFQNTSPPQPAWEYYEINLDKAYSGQTSSFGVNWYYANSMYGDLVNPTLYWNVFREPSTSPTPRFWKWTGSTTRARPYYPTFNTAPDGTGTQLFPPPLLSTYPSSWSSLGCSLYTASGMKYTGNFYVSAYCTSGCYTPDQNLRFSDGDVNIASAMRAKRDDLVTLAPDATLDDLRTQTAQVHSYTAEIRDLEHPIFKVTTASGGSLSVTSEHPVVISDGRLVKAEALRKGQELVKADGTPDPIVHIEKTRFFGKVYNVKPLSTDRVANLLIAQGFLVGSGRFQNEDVEYMNRILLFRAVPDAVIPK